MDRYRIRGPMCHHKPIQRVEAGDSRKGAHASTVVCGRQACIDDALAWARAVTHLDPQVLPFGRKVTVPE